MAAINDQGNIQARCSGCNGALSSFIWRKDTANQYGVVSQPDSSRWPNGRIDFRLYRCAGCGMGALGVVVYYTRGGTSQYPGTERRLHYFNPEAKERLSIPPSVPNGITTEFREGEKCLEAGCNRAAAGMFRSVLDKTLRANGYKEGRGTSLASQIDAAAKDGVITAARQKRAHEEIRVLGNDVLHDEWHTIDAADVELARHYAQRILEDFYDDRGSVLALLRSVGRTPEEDHQPETAVG